MVIQGFPVVAMHNRYAKLNAEELPPKIISGKHAVCAPVDVESGGTWIGFNDAGLFAAVTDQHTGEEKPAEKSRGKLLLHLLSSFDNAREAVNHLKAEASEGYKKGNYLIADRHEAYHLLYDGKIYLWKLKPGPHILTNLTVLPGWRLEGETVEIYRRVKVRRGRAAELLKRITGGLSVEEVLKELKVIASDHEGKPGETSICYHGKGEWKMTSSTIIALAENPAKSKILYAKGNPCVNPFQDYSTLMSRFAP